MNWSAVRGYPFSNNPEFSRVTWSVNLKPVLSAMSNPNHRIPIKNLPTIHFKTFRFGSIVSNGI